MEFTRSSKWSTDDRRVKEIVCQMLCTFAHQFPPFVENFLERGRTLRRRFREESVTDLMMGSLVTAGAGRVIVEFPDEPVTGADMEWNFVNPSDSTFFRILLQAKQAYGDGSFWTRHCYRELLHTSGSGTKLQAETLCDTAGLPGSATYPLYIFYHAASTCTQAQASGKSHVAGVNLADGYVIERLVKGATDRTTRTSNKSLRLTEPHLFPLTQLFCPPTVLSMPTFALSPPTPRDIRNRLAERQDATRVTAKSALDAPVPEVPAVADFIPDDVQAILHRESPERESRRKLYRHRITFVSAGPPEEEARHHKERG